MLDYFSYNSFSVRNIFFYKIYSKDFYNFEFLCLNAIKLFFELKNLEEIDSLSLSNYFYLFRFFFGKKAFLYNYFSEFHFGTIYYNLNIECLFSKNEVYCFLNFMANDYFFFLKKNNFYFVGLENNSYLIKLIDMNIFMEKKTTSGLFFLRNNLFIKFFMSGPIFYQSGKVYLSSLNYFKFYGFKNLTFSRCFFKKKLC